MKVSFIIPLFNRLELTKACLASLQATVPAGLSHEILLIDDGSTDGTRDWISTLPVPVRAIPNERNLGFAASNNRGAREARGEILALLNNDLVLLPGWLPPMLEALEGDPSIGVVGNVQLRVGDNSVDHSGLQVTSNGKVSHDRTRPSPGLFLEVPGVTAACVLVRRRLFIDCGGFDEAFINGGEDVDLCLRLSARGLRTVVATDSLVQHHVSASRGPTNAGDERNSRLLARRWRNELIHWGTLTWAREQLEDPPASSFPLSGRQRRALRTFLDKRGRPPEFARLRLESAFHREETRWRHLLDLPEGASRTPRAPGKYRVHEFLRDELEGVWIKDHARVELPEGFPTANLFLAGFFAPADPRFPRIDLPIGFRITINRGQSASLPAVPVGNFNFGIDAPYTFPDRPTLVEVDLLGVGRTNLVARVLRILARGPTRKSWRRRMEPYRYFLLNRRLRFTRVVCDDEVIFDFRNDPALVGRLRGPIQEGG